MSFDDLDHAHLARLRDALGRAARLAAEKTLATLGIASVGDVSAALDRAGIAEHMAPLVRYWASAPPIGAAPSFDDIRTLAPEAAPLIDYVERACQALLPLLREEVSPLDVYLIDDGGKAARFLYAESALAKACNATLATLLRDRTRGAVLEVGAGTGGTTETLVRALGDRPYTASDIAPAFVTRLKKKLPQIATCVCDIDAPLPPVAYGAIVAANCLHTAKNVDRTARHLRAALEPGGALLLWETTSKEPWFDVTLVFIQGWQSAKRIEPLRCRSEWRTLLHAAGFAAIEILPAEPLSHGHAIILARCPS